MFYLRDSLARPELRFLLLDPDRIRMIAVFAKICVPLFVFVTAYGLATKYQTTDDLSAEGISRVTAKRLRSLMIPFWYVFVIAQLFSNITGLRPYHEVYGYGLQSLIFFTADGLGLASFYSTPTLNDTWWYMSVALLLPLAVPVLCIIERRTGWVFLPVLLLVAKGMEYRGFTKYLIIALMAIVIRRYDVIEKIERRLEGRTALRVLIMAADIALLAVNCYMINTLCEDDTWLTLVYLASTFLVVLMYVLVIKGITPLKAFLIKTGKHSMNVFLTHTFIYYYFFADFIYSFRYVPAIWLALFTTSMALAVILDYTGGRLTKAAGDMLERTVKRETRCA